MRKWFVGFFMLALTACNPKSPGNQPTATVLNDHEVSFKGAILDHDALMQLKQATLSREEWSNILPVIPADADIDVEPNAQVLGDYVINDTEVIFSAQKPFEKNVQYIAHFYASDAGLSYLKLAQAKQNLKGPNGAEFRFRVK